MEMALEMPVSVSECPKANRHAPEYQVAIPVFSLTDNLTTKDIHIKIPDLSPSFRENRQRITQRGP
jgi:hypothetical protein